MGKKIIVKWPGEKYEARYQVDTDTGVVKDLNNQSVTRGDLMAVIGNLHSSGKSDIARKVQEKYFNR